MSSGGDPRGLWGRDTSRFFKVVNFELYAKPNVMVGILGTGAFLGIFSALLWNKHQFDREEKQQQIRKKASPKTFHEEE